MARKTKGREEQAKRRYRGRESGCERKEEVVLWSWWSTVMVWRAGLTFRGPNFHSDCVQEHDGQWQCRIVGVVDLHAWAIADLEYWNVSAYYAFHSLSHKTPSEIQSMCYSHTAMRCTHSVIKLSQETEVFLLAIYHAQNKSEWKSKCWSTGKFYTLEIINWGMYFFHIKNEILPVKKEILFT